MRFLPRAKLTRRTGFKLAISAVSARFFRSKLAAAPVPGLLDRIPGRTADAPTGSQFAASVAQLDKERREQAILTQLLKGNVPGFLRKLIPVHLTHELAAGAALAATIFVMPEYLAIGSDTDFLRIPMNLYTAANVARSFGFVLPTRKIVDAIYDQSGSRFTPQPLPAGPQMTSTGYYQRHNAMIEQQSRTRGLFDGALAAGHKKDVVLTNWLRRNPGHIAIYGWHRAKGDPIQPLSTVHGARYADYSHGIRLIANMAMIEGKTKPVSEILQDAKTAPVLSDEGPLHVPGFIA
jgi:hypothetical protein